MGGTDTERRVRTALGVLGEAVSALRGVHELCASRGLGPVQILPAIETFLDSSLGLAGQMRMLFGVLGREAAGSPLGPAVEALERALPGPLDAVARAFGRSSWAKLGARDRLELERAVGGAAADIDGIRSLCELVYAALHPRLLELGVRELVESHRASELARARAAQSTAGPAPQALSVLLGIADERSFSADPHVAWGVLEVLLRAVAASGGAELCVRPAGDWLEVEVAARGHHSAITQDGVRWSELVVVVGPGLPVDLVVAGAAAAQLGLRLERGPSVQRLGLPIEPPSWGQVAAS
ncbi:MAG: hypothetical protein IT373_01340 [Polyangiaceae bacterium]|nr:hypothetical protein [Polyangiaceae bacterium]